MLLSVITIGLLGFASMSQTKPKPAAKPDAKCACGTYPLYLTEAEAGGVMCHHMLKVTLRPNPAMRCAPQ